MITKEKFSKICKSNVATAKAYERRVKKLLTEWSGHEFRRRRVEGRGNDISVVEGVADVIPVDGKIIFAIEVKKEKGFSFDSLLANPHNNKFTKWWFQVCYDAKILTDRSGDKKWPLLFFKPHPNFDWIAIAREPFLRGVLRSSKKIVGRRIWFPHLVFDEFKYCGQIKMNVSRSKNEKLVNMILEPCIICRWTDFAANISPKSIFIE
jgi:hypothetical protein